MADSAGTPSSKVSPSYARGVVWCDLREILPDFVTDAMAEALPLLDRKLAGFADADAVMTGVETRSSSPVRILRDEETLQAWRRKPQKRVRPRDIARGHGRPPQEEKHIPCGIYPCGEGAGYAGGIMSAAVDGLRVAQKVAFCASMQATSFQDVVAALKAGKPVIFPTDTVYGLGVSVGHAESPQAIYDLKHRQAGKPVAWLVGGIEALDEYGDNVPEEAYRLAQDHWPGALTLIVRANERVPKAFASEQGTIGLRMPDSEDALSLIAALGCPLATSSANISGDADPCSEAELDPRLREQVGACLETSQPLSGIASTVVDCSDGTMRILRQGSVSIEGE